MICFWLMYLVFVQDTSKEFSTVVKFLIIYLFNLNTTISKLKFYMYLRTEFYCIRVCVCVYIYTMQSWTRREFDPNKRNSVCFWNVITFPTLREKKMTNKEYIQSVSCMYICTLNICRIISSLLVASELNITIINI